MNYGLMRNEQDVLHWLEGWKPVRRVKPVLLTSTEFNTRGLAGARRRRPKSKKSKRGK